LAVAIEDAGFEIRDQIQWIYGSGFPKSLDVSKAMDKQAGATREVVTEVREDMFGEYEVINSYKVPDSKKVNPHFISSDENRKPHGDYNKSYYPTTPSTDLAKQWQGWGTALKPAHEPAVLARKPLCGTVADNVMAWGVGALNIDGTRIATEDDMARPASNGRHMEDRPWVKRRINAGLPSRPETPDNGLGRWPANVILDEDAAKALDAQSGGNVSRFFYTAKASKAEREAGLDAPIGERANIHTTVKPLSLMRYLVRLVTPKGGKVLDPFMGSGSTGCAAVLEGFDFVGIDITPEYVAIAQKRVDHYAVTSPLMEL
jgi:site-specific DNA-methyltransferase (adenine-specific)